MNALKNRFKAFFLNIDYPVLGQSLQEVFWMTAIALCPLLINIIIASISMNDLTKALEAKIVPGEVLSYCLGFMAPSLYLMTKIQGTSYKLPFSHGFSIITIVIYVLTVVLYLIIKNSWVKGINLEVHPIDFYFRTTLVFLATTIILRVYSVYHGRNSSNWSRNRNQQQNDFNATFTESIK